MYNCPVSDFFPPKPVPMGLCWEEIPKGGAEEYTRTETEYDIFDTIGAPKPGAPWKENTGQGEGACSPFLHSTYMTFLTQMEHQAVERQRL